MKEVVIEVYLQTMNEHIIDIVVSFKFCITLSFKIYIYICIYMSEN
jgi:hypothetical protein